jgi:S1-C subfamily serine protease
VKRPYLGIQVAEDKINAGDGAHIGQVAKDGAAASIGLQKGDIITKINDANINSWTELQATVSSYNSGDKINVTYRRNGKEYTTSAILTSKTGTYDQIASAGIGEVLGAELETLDKKKALTYDIEGGVLVKKIAAGGPFSRTRMQDGFIITSVSGMDVTSIDELKRAITSLQGESIQLEGIYPGYEGVYRYPLNLED